MKNIFAVIGVMATLLAGSWSVISFADNKRGDDAHRHHGAKHEARMLKKLSNALDLTDDQQAEVAVLISQVKPLMQQARETRSAVRREMMTFDNIGADFDTRMIQLADEQAESTRQMVLELSQLKLQFSQVLTADQLTKAAELENMFEGRRGGKKHRKHERSGHTQRNASDQSVTE